MNEFVQECRSEWKRLGVPDPVAEEMAAELEADLEEAAAEGVSTEYLLGSSATDPRSFAAAWAGERGILPSTAPGRGGMPAWPPRRRLRAHRSDWRSACARRVALRQDAVDGRGAQP